jgi:hypothetical protein
MSEADRLRQVRVQHFANELVLGQDARARSQSFALLVEGPDDVRVFNSLTCPKRCRIYHVEGKRQILNQVKAAMRWGTERRTVVSRFLGIIDRDFDGDEEPLPARVSFLSDRFADLEAVVLAFRGDQIVGDLVDRSALSRDRREWLFSRAADETCLARFVTEVVGPCGALRNTWPPDLQGGFNQNLSLIDDLLQARLTAGFLDARSIQRVLANQINDDEVAEGLANRSAQAFRNCADPWKLVRGKDLVQAVAHYLRSQTGLYLYPRESAKDTRHKIRNTALTLFDHDVLSGAGTAELADVALARFQESSRDFLGGAP